MEVKITSANFESEVKDSESPVLLDFWATRMIAPELERLDKDMAGSIKIGKINVDEKAALAAKFNIEVIPTLVLMDKGEIKKRFSGYATAEDLKEKIK